MPLPFTRCDALRCFLTGAAADGGAQASAAASLGNYRSSTRAGGLGFYLTEMLPGVTIDFAAPANGVGGGALYVSGVNELRWSAPGQPPGNPVAIANGQQVLIEGSTPSRFILATRTTASDLAGSAAVQLAEPINDVFGQSDGVLPQGNTYRLVCLKNGPTQALLNLLVWIGAADNAIAIAKELPGSQPAGNFQTIASETTAPAAVTFVSPTSSADPNVISVAKLLPNEQVGIWIRRSLASAVASPRARTQLNWSYTAVG